MTLWMVLLGALIGCGSSSSEPAPQEQPAAGARGKHAKRKGKARAKMKRRKGKAKGLRKPIAPVGAAGEVSGTLVLTTVEEPAGRATKMPPAKGLSPAEPPAAPGAASRATPTPPGTAEEAPEPVEAAATPMVTRTKAELQLTWGDDGTSTVSLGKVRGTCSDAPTKPVGPPGKEKTPLWTVHCVDGDRSLDLFILQVGNRISVIREVARPKGAKAFKPVKRIPLVPGAVLKRTS